jgi:hypothetical protein
MGHCGEFGDARRARALDLVMFHIWAIAPNQLCTMAQNHAKYFLEACQTLERISEAKK